jgi:mono/diheme cytochrome c family protein
MNKRFLTMNALFSDCHHDRSMKHTSRSLPLSFICIVLASFGLIGSPAAGQNAKAPAGNRENGKKLYADNACYACHGDLAEGGSGPRLGPMAIPFPDFLERIRRPTDVMPPFDENMISDESQISMRL